MSDFICHIAPLGKNPDWIKEGLLYYDWNYLVVLITDNKEFLDVANTLKEDLEGILTSSDEKKLDPKLIKEIEILKIKSRDPKDYLEILSSKIKIIKKLNYKIYFNATSGLEMWKFIAYFLAAERDLIDKFYYIPKDLDANNLIKPYEIHLPLRLPNPLRNLLILLNSKSKSQKELIKETNLSKGLISRYINSLNEMELIQIANKRIGKERFYELTEKGKWYIY